MTVFYLIRHATHSLNDDIIAGRAPQVLLSDVGRAQATQLAERLADVPLRALYCSPLERAHETAQILGTKLDLEPQICADLNELNFGEWTGKTLDELREFEQWRDFNRFRSGIRAPGGETMLEAQARIVGALEQLRARHRDECVALVSHGDVIKAAVAYFLGVPLDLFGRIEIARAAVSVIAIADYGPQVWCVNSGGALPVPE